MPIDDHAALARAGLALAEQVVDVVTDYIGAQWHHDPSRVACLAAVRALLAERDGNAAATARDRLRCRRDGQRDGTHGRPRPARRGRKTVNEHVFLTAEQLEAVRSKAVEDMDIPPQRTGPDLIGPIRIGEWEIVSTRAEVIAMASDVLALLSDRAALVALVGRAREYVEADEADHLPCQRGPTCGYCDFLAKLRAAGGARP